MIDAIFEKWDKKYGTYILARSALLSLLLVLAGFLFALLNYSLLWLFLSLSMLLPLLYYFSKTKETVQGLYFSFAIFTILPLIISLIALIENNLLLAISGIAISISQYIIQTRMMRFYLPKEDIKKNLSKNLAKISLTTENGESILLEKIIDRPTIFVSFRGNWCAYCVANLKEFIKFADEIYKLGAKVIFISNQTPEKSLELKNNLATDIIFLSDQNLSFADLLNIRHTKGNPGFSKDSPEDVFYPTVILCDSGSEIRHIELSEHLRLRTGPMAIFSHLEKIIRQDKLNLLVKERTIELKNKNDILNKLFEEKTNLLRLLSHDLNNTLTVIVSSNTYAEANTEGRIKAMLQKSLRAAHMQAALINQVRTLEALNSGKQKLELKPIHLDSIMEQIQLIFQDKLKAKNIKLDYSLNSSIKVLAEENSLCHTVIGNIVSNAIKFSKENTTITIHSENMENNLIKVKIEDEGVGIPKDLLEKLFRSDVNTSRLGTSGEKGTGFGMPLVKTFMEHFGGKIEVESYEYVDEQTKHGTAFILYFKTV